MKPGRQQISKMLNIFGFESYIFALALLFFYIILQKIPKPSTSKKSYRFPPSPLRLPLIGNLHQLSSLPHRSLASLSRNHGPLMLLNLGQVPTLVVSSAEMAKEVMRIHDNIFSGRPSVLAARLVLYNCRDIIFSQNSESWRNLRKLCNLHLLSAKRVQSFQHIREDEIDRVISEVSRTCVSADGLADMTDLIQSFSNNIICRVVTGETYQRSQDRRHYEKLKRLVHDIDIVFSQFYFQDYFPWLACLDAILGSELKARNHSETWDAVLDQVISDHVDRVKNDENQDFVDVLLSLNKDSSSGFTVSRDEMKALLVDVFAAGASTSYICLEWAMAELIRSPQIMKKLQEEIRHIVTDKRTINEEDLPKMVFLKAVIKEILRLHPPTPLLLPHETTDDCELQGFYIPKNTRVIVNAWKIGRDPDVWEEAEEFKPERFINSDVNYAGNHFQFIPFGAGRRICPGMNFGASVLEIGLANLVYHFDWELPPGVKIDQFDMSESSGLGGKRKQKLNLVAKPWSCVVKEQTVI